MMAGANEAPAPCCHQNTNCRMMPARRRKTLALAWPPKLKRSKEPVAKTGRNDELTPHDREPLTASLTNKVNRPDREPKV